MKHFFSIILMVILCLPGLKGQNMTNILNGTTLLYTFPIHVDTLKDPTGARLKKKQKKLESKALQQRDFTLSKEKRIADKLYESLGYMKAAEKYEQLEGMERNRFVLEKLANSYRLNGQTEDAEYCYAQIIKDTDNPEDYLHYAQVLQINGKCEDAVRWYKEYMAKSFDTRRDFLVDCEVLKEFKTSNVEIKNRTELNTELLDFCAMPYRDGVVFTSTRGTQKLAKRRDNWTKNSFSDLFFAKKGNHDEYTQIELLAGDINGKFHDGVASFNRAGTKMFFTRNSPKRKSKKGTRLLKIYEADNDHDFWTNVRELPFNSDEFSNCHPTLSRDGRRLYFASDRDGGYGGMDIYMSENIGGHWREPVNLGPNVNTSGNEVFPFIADDETLYFSSDGHLGIGGLDIFSVKKKNPLDESSWGSRENIGRPFNSSRDDFGFVINDDKESGWFSSSRLDGIGGDDIYEWHGKINETKEGKTDLSRTICVYDPASGTRIDGVSVTVFKTSPDGKTRPLSDQDWLVTLKPLDESNREYIISIVEKSQSALGGSGHFVTNAKGTFSYQPDPEGNYIFVLEKPGFHTTRQTFSAAEILEDQEFCIPLEKRHCLTLNGVVKNRDYPAFIPDAEVKLFNKCTGELEAVYSDAKGAFEFCLDCGCEYEIYANKTNFVGNSTIVSTENQDCEQLELQPPIVATIDMSVSDQPDLSAVSPNGNVAPYSTPDWRSGAHHAPQVVYVPVPGNYYAPDAKRPARPQDLNGYFLGDPNAPFTEGQTIRLSNIYYDFDKFYIRGDAAQELDYVYQLLKTYPTMEIALIAHTDARGSDAYNEKLSRKRAKAAVQYLIDRGIEPHRLVAMGVGESRLVNGCDDGVDCPESEHQKNRRTEIRILKLNEPGVRVQYED
ncbi:MAG: hypothetical protein D6714_21290 [Bacteroidetes bacterium]|nr:MAG: hypothetical protein D6714_21290 [Bacteroidota bacterium]